MSDKPILEYEPLPPRGLRRKTVIALLAASAGVSIVAGGVVYRLSQSTPPPAVTPPPPVPPIGVDGGIGIAPRSMPWQPAQSPQTERADGR